MGGRPLAALILALALAAGASGQTTVPAHEPSRPPQRARSGLAVDAAGEPVVDPTKNVLDLVDAATRRIDDLGAADRRYYDALANADRRYYDSQIARLVELTEIRADHQRQLDAAESARIDSIRQVDVLATATTAAQALAAIQTLAASQAAQAETLRLAVGDTANTIATQLASITTEINKRITALEQGAYEGAGKARVADPQYERLAGEVDRLANREATVTGKDEGISTAWAVMFAVVGLFLTLVTIAVAVGGVYLAMRKRNEPPARRVVTR